MTIFEVRERLEEIKTLANDSEAAHSREDGLYFDVLRAIADGETDDPAGLAAEALKTLGIDFDRWCA